MSKYIDLELAKALVKDGKVSYEDLLKLPEADVREVKHARWKKIGLGLYECSRCHFNPARAGNLEVMRCCPKCEAVIDSVDE